MQLLFYLISVISSTTLFVIAILILSRLKQKRILCNVLLALFCIYIVVTILGSYTFFYFNGFFPNFYTYEYFKNEPLSAFILLKDTINMRDIAFFTVGFIVMFYFLRKLTNQEYSWASKRIIFPGLVLYLSLLTLMVVKIKKYDQCLIVDSNFSAAINRHLFENEEVRKFTGKGLAGRNPYKIPHFKEKRDFNVLVVVFESLRKQNLNVYGYYRQTTPNMSEFAKRHRNEFYIFRHPYTVSSTTMLAVPGVLTGIGPYQDPEIFYSQPIMWDYGNMLNYRTFFVSSHSMQWYRFDRFYKNEKLSHRWSKETSGKPFFNDLGIDDKYTIAHVNKLISQKNDQPFFGIVQMNATHYPYKVPKGFRRWKGKFIDEYDNSILYQDHVIGKLFDQLKKSGKLENTIVVFTSDHGESIKDHNNIGHVDSYYIETISVPLMFYIPKSITKNLNVKTLKENLTKNTSNIDIAPTIVEILGLNKKKELKYILRNFTGYSLFKPIPVNRAIITMNNNEIARFKVGISLIRNNLHYIHRTNIVPYREELYDVKKDPREKKNLIKYLNGDNRKKLMDCFKIYPVSEKYLPEK